MRLIVFLPTYLSFILPLISCNGIDRSSRANNGLDSLSYTYKHSQFTQKLQEAKDSLSLFHASIVYPDINFGNNQALKDSVDNFLIYSVFRGYKTADDANKAFVDESMQQTEGTEGFTTTGWESDDSITVVTNTPKVLCLKQNHYSYTGGAHGNPFESYVNFRPSDGKVLVFKDVLDMDNIQKFKSLNLKHLKKHRNIAPTNTLEDKGLFVLADDLPLPATFALTKSGIIMSYNYYEIASYADGVISYIIPYNELEGLIKEEYMLNK